MAFNHQFKPPPEGCSCAGCKAGFFPFECHAKRCVYHYRIPTDEGYYEAREVSGHLTISDHSVDGWHALDPIQAKHLMTVILGFVNRHSALLRQVGL